MSEEESKLKDMPYLKTNSFDFNQSMWDSRKNNDIDRQINQRNIKQPMSEKMYLDPISKNKFITKDEYFKIMFGEEFMDSTFKGTIQEYEARK